MEVRSTRGVTLVFTDALFNMPHAGGVNGFLFRMIGASGCFHMSPIAKRLLLADRSAYATHLRAQAARGDVVRVIVTHGDMLERDIPSHLEAAAAEIAPA